MKRFATAQWQGDGQSGRGILTTQSGALNAQPYGFAMRFQDESGKSGTNPEELMGAAHAGCFAMALSFMLSAEGHAPDALDVRAEVTIDKQGEGFMITAITLDLKARVRGLDAAQFQQLADRAKAQCPVSQALKAVPISLRSELVAGQA